MDISSLSAISSLVPQSSSSAHASPATHPARPTSPPRANTTQAARQNRQGAEVVAQGRTKHAVIEKLKARDREVRAHEQAHLARAGGLAKGGPRFSFQRGPDGKLYAVGGSVQIDTSPVPGNPAATIQKARQIRSAALAPANPSGQDRAVAATAARMEAQARLEAQQQPSQRPSPTSPTDPPSPGTMIDLFA